MAEIVKKYKESADRTSFSRYKNLYRLVDSNGDSYMETPDRVVIDKDVTDSFYEVGKGYEHRLDLISYKFYNTTMLWWVIAEINDIRNPLTVDAGTVLRIPTLSRLYGSGGNLL